MKRQDIEDIYPLSPIQEGILFQVRGEPERHDYIARTAWDIEGSFDSTRFADAWKTVFARHPILRTGFSWHHSETPVQLVFKSVSPAIATLDWRGKDDVERQFKWWLGADLQQGFNLQKPPLMRLTILRLSTSLWRLVWTRHHLLLDGWSNALLLGEVFRVYHGQKPGQTPPPFRAYINWLKQQDNQNAENWWRQKLKGFCETTPVGPQKPVSQSSGGLGEVSIEIPKLQVLPGLTLNTMVQGVWALYLARFAGKSDVLHGCTVAGRSPDLPGSDQMIGLFINTLPLRSQFRSEAPIGTWLQSLQVEMAGMRSREHHPLSSMRTWSDIPADQPFFQSIVVFENYPVETSLQDATSNSATQISLAFRDERTHYPLALYALPRKDKLILRLCYDAGLFTQGTAATILRRLEFLLEQVTTNPNQSYERISLTDPREKKHLLATWNETDRPLPIDATLTALLQQQKENTPDTIALKDRNGQWTYAALHDEAQAIANHLQSLGLQPESHIGIALPRDHRSIVALLAILKAGYAYLPLDTRFPEERLRYIVADSEVTHVISDAALPWLSEAQTLLWQTFGNRPCNNQVVIYPDQRAYTLYTSGSTGRPKGVDIPHRAVVNLIRSMAKRPGLQHGDQFLALTTLSFDISVLEIFLPLCSGAALVLADEETASDPMMLEAALSQVSHAQATPATWKMLYAGGWQGASQLNVWCGGEAVPADLAHQLARDCCTFWNMYGPTETTVWSGTLPLSDGAPIVVGGAIDNTQIHILDPHLQPVPEGFAGEIMIAGSGLARGYHHRPTLTAQVFMPNPYKKGQRLYRTGDLGIRREDGSIHFLGRVDHQVKIRGHRIEIGEIESVLRQSESIQEAVVSALPDASGDICLVAFLVSLDKESLCKQTIRLQLGNQLPSYMVPAYFVDCHEMPLTPNGKIDRKALGLAWQPCALRASKDHKAVIAPRDKREQSILEHFQAILSQKKIGVTHNFFELGGHSLQATRLLARLRKSLGIHVPLHTFFQQPTVAHLAAVAQNFAKQIKIPHHPERTVFPLSPSQKRLLFLHRFEEGSHAYHLASAVRIRGPLNTLGLDEAYSDLVMRHPILRTVYKDEGQYIHSQPLNIPIHQVLQNDASVWHQTFLNDFRKPFKLEEDAPLRMTSYQVGPEEHLLILVAHHIALDARGLEITLHDLIRLYRTQTEGLPHQLPELKIHYGDFALWQNEMDHQENRLWWSTQLEDLQDLALPHDLPRPKLQTFNGARLDFQLPMLNELQQLSNQQGTTLFMTLLAMFQLQLSRWCGQEDIAVGVPVSGRDRQEAQQMLGCFINTLVMRTGLENNPTFEEILNRTRKTVLESMAHASFPFEELLQSRPGRRDLSRPPLFQVLFNFRTEEEPTHTVHALDWQPLSWTAEGAKYELSLILRHRDSHLQAAFEYNTDLFHPESIEALRDDFFALIQALLHRPTSRLVPEECGRVETFEKESTPPPTAASGLFPAEEARLCALFAEVLGATSVGVHDHFFEIGGHSLKAIQVLGRLRIEGKRLPLKTFFLNPTAASLAPYLAEAKTDQQSFLSSAPRDAYPSLSPAQERLWAAHQLAPSSNAYHMPLAMVVTGDLNPELVIKSAFHLAQTYEILRTRFPLHGGRPYQQVMQEPDIAVFQEKPDTTNENDLETTLRELASQPFHLTEHPPWRIHLLPLDSNRTAILMNQHHIIGDDWSTALLGQQFFKTYATLARNEDPTLISPALQYVDYAMHQQKCLREGTLNKEKAYWQQQLADYEPLRLPKDDLHIDPGSPEGDQVFLQFNCDTTSRLKQLTLEQDVTLFTLLLTLWQSLLYRYQESDDICVGTSIAGRDTQTEDMPGCFVNTLAMRAKFPPGISFRQLLHQNKETTAMALDHALLPFEKVLSGLDQTSGQDLLSAFFVLHSASQAVLQDPKSWQETGLDVQQLQLNTGAARFDMSLSLKEENGELRGGISYRRHLFSRKRVMRMATHLHTLMDAVLAKPNQPLAQLPLLKAEEQVLYLQHGSNGQDLGTTKWVIGEVLNQASSNPQAIALQDLHQTHTYASLLKRVQALAGGLHKQGLQKEEVVAIAAHRNVDTVVAMLAVQWAGGVCLPLEIDTPQERLQFVSTDLNIRFVVGTQQNWACDLWRPVTPEASSDYPPQQPDQAQLAYLIYTSGSTGIPKAVGVSTKALWSYVAAISQHLEPEPGDQWMMVTTLAADLGLTALYPGLVHGGTVHIMDRDTVLDADKVVTYIAESEIDYLKCTPSWFKALLSHDFPEMATPKKALLLGGEASDRDLLNHILELGDARVFNHYGPSECTIGAVLHEIQPKDTGPIPIGSPLPNAWALVMDRNMQPLPVGIPGELLLGGSQLARGYVGRPALTASHFVPHPFGTDGERLYRTGDRVVRCEDGQLLFLGRLDQQVKLRGYRVELGEIEAVLETQVGKAVAMVIGEGSDARLHAFVCEASQIDLAGYLATRLPAYMIPSAIHHLEALPITRNGKLDRKALIAHTHKTPERQCTSQRAPSTPEERTIAGIWSRLLGREVQTVEDSFFALGGDSIVAIQALVQLRTAGYQLTPAAFFKNPTLGAQAALLSQSSQPQPTAKVKVTGEVPLSPIQHWFFQRHGQKDPHHFNQAVLLACKEKLEETQLRDALHALVAHHDVFRYRYQLKAGNWQQFAETDHPLYFEKLDLSHLTGEALSQTIEDHAKQCQQSLDLERGLLHRIIWFQTAQDEQDRLLFVMHHLIVDGVSWRILLADLEQIYTHPEARLDQGTDFSECSLSLIKHLPRFRDQIDTWKMPEVEPFPSDWEEGPNDEASTQVHRSRLSPATTSALLNQTDRHIQVYLLTALVLTFEKVYRQSQLLIHLEGHGRDEQALELDASRTVGWLTSVYPVLLQTESTLEDSLQATQTRLQNIPDNGIGFGALRYLDKTAVLTEKSTPQLIFNYMGRFDAVLSGSTLFQAAREQPGPTHAPSQIRDHLLDLNASVLDDHLRVAWRFSHHRYHHQTIEQLASEYLHQLEALLAHDQSCQLTEVPS